jgi:aminopeptidase N
VNAEGSGDMYYKGGSMLHTIRHLVNDDEKWRRALRGLQSTFWHQTVTAAQVENYMSQQTGMDLSKVFQQYLTTNKVPTLEYAIDHDRLSYRWVDVVPGFTMPVRVAFGPDASYEWIKPTAQWTKLPRPVAATSDSAVRVDPNFYVLVRPAAATPGK